MSLFGYPIGSRVGLTAVLDTSRTYSYNLQRFTAADNRGLTSLLPHSACADAVTNTNYFYLIGVDSNYHFYATNNKIY